MFGIIVFVLMAFYCPAQKILHVAVAGLAHDHVHGILNQYKKGEVIITGIAESDEQLVHAIRNLISSRTLFLYRDLESLLEKGSRMPYLLITPSMNTSALSKSAHPKVFP